MSDKKDMILGVLGGLGPQATVYFTDMIIRYTDADTDQEHIPMIVFNDSRIPDRTAYILDHEEKNPVPLMIEDSKKLEQAGAGMIVIPCNTAHFFYEEIEKNVSVPVVNIIDETVRWCMELRDDVKRIGLLATEGTYESGAYKKYTDSYGLELITPDKKDVAGLMTIIYDQVKAGEKVDIRLLNHIISNMKRRGSDVVVLGCTELSVINMDLGLTKLDGEIVDSLEVLVKRTIEYSGRVVKNI